MADNEDLIALPAGYKIGKYRIVRELGSGTFGITYLAHEEGSLERKVAIKEYLPNDIAKRNKDVSVQAKNTRFSEYYKAGLDKFVEEAKTLTLFRHPNIVRVIDLIEKVNNTAYMVMDYEDGEQLGSLLERVGPLNEETLRHIFFPKNKDGLLNGLKELHDKKFLHRDIKPDNIYIRSKDATAVLLDFGATRPEQAGRDHMTVMLTKGYAPIEQYETDGKNQGPWTDIYALGATMYRCIGLERPPEATDRSAAKRRKDKDPMLSALEVVKSVGKYQYSDHFLKAIDHALAIYDEDRPRSVAAWRAELEGESVPLPWKKIVVGGMVTAGVIAGGLWLRSTGVSPVPPTPISILPIPSPKQPLLIIDSIPSGQDVFIDNVKKGKTKIVVDELPYGSHKLRIIGDPEQYIEYNETINISEQDIRPKEILGRLPKIPQLGDILVQSEPNGAEIYINGKNFGATPKKISGVDKGEKQIEIRLKGYKAWSSNESLGDKLLEVNATLVKDEPKVGDMWKDSITGMEFMWVPQDRFLMGMSDQEKNELKSDSNYDISFKDAENKHEVFVNALWVGKTEVTVGQFRKFVKATGYKTDAEKDTGGKQGCFSHVDKEGKRSLEYVAGRSWQDPGYSQEENFPVVCVSWVDAQAFVKWMNKGTE
ncbi:MAG: PEGA domain-containing protein, partial [Magnetococcales bacterium]|nr:PEGA domain-containing protein [Magnetococcales bacterium]